MSPHPAHPLCSASEACPQSSSPGTSTDRGNLNQLAPLFPQQKLNVTINASNFQRKKKKGREISLGSPKSCACLLKPD